MGCLSVMGGMATASVGLVAGYVPFPAASLSAELESLLAKLPHASARAAACVLEPATGRVIFEYRADEPMVPASANKVFVMAAGLNDLGPDFAFETLLGIIGDDLFVIGSGDPGFGDPRLCEARGEAVTQVFSDWAMRLKARGLTSFPGRLVLDDSVFEDRWVHPTWKADEGKWYAAPVAGLCINDNCVTISVRPSVAGSPPSWSSVPVAPKAIELVNQCKSGKGPGPVLHASNTRPYLRLTGTIDKPVELEAPYAEPVMLFGDALRTALAAESVTVQGETVHGRVRGTDGALPPRAEIIAVHRTPMRDVLARIGRNSQNLFAECLLKHLGYRADRVAGAADPRGGWENGSRAVIAALEQGGVNVAALNLADGSGLSRANRCTARQLAATLAWMDRHAGGALLRASLSEPGEEGSLRSMTGELGDFVRAKTGTMSGIRSLAGYLKSRSGGEYVFAIVFNEYTGGSAPYKTIQTQFCRVLVDKLP